VVYLARRLVCGTRGLLIGWIIIVDLLKGGGYKNVRKREKFWAVTKFAPKSAVFFVLLYVHENAHVLSVFAPEANLSCCGSVLAIPLLSWIHEIYRPYEPTDAALQTS
jgi:hypothetical protein